MRVTFMKGKSMDKANIFGQLGTLIKGIFTLTDGKVLVFIFGQIKADTKESGGLIE